MVIRIMRTQVKAEAVHEFRTRIMTKVADARNVDGVIDVHVGSQADATGSLFVFVSRWESMAALYTWAGGPDLLARPIYFDGLEDALIDFDIQHYVDIEAVVS
jgi:quinol monooxygenase YgiN